MKVYFGIDFGGTNIKIGLFDENLNLLLKHSIPTLAQNGPDYVLDEIAGECKIMLEQQGLSLKNLQYTGIGCPGPVDLSAGVLVTPPNLPLFQKFPMRKSLSDRLFSPVVMENDANAAGWAEHVVGAAKGVEEMVFLTLGTGIGGAVIANGQLVHGHLDAAGELGHIIIYADGRDCGCGQKGCAEAYSSASSTAKRANEALAAGRQSSLQQIYKLNGEVTCPEIYEHLEKGDELAKEITEETAKVLGLLCVNILNFTSPEKIVFAGGMIEAGNTLLSRIKFYFDKYIWPGRENSVEICFAALAQDAGIIGNAALAIKQSHSEK